MTRRQPHRNQAERVEVDPRHTHDLSRFLAYPSGDHDLTAWRIEELEGLGVSAVLLEGETELAGLNLLGKGTTSLVLKGDMRDSLVALKVLRSDSNRETVEHEAAILDKVNSLGVGPRLLSHSEGVLVLELVTGIPFHRHLAALANRETSPSELRESCVAALRQCGILDFGGVDHGQLHKPHKHVFVREDKSVKIIDFESASLDRTPSNVSSLTQYLLFNSPVSDLLRERLLGVPLERLFLLLRNHKRDPTQGSYGKILTALLGQSP